MSSKVAKRGGRVVVVLGVRLGGRGVRVRSMELRIFLGMAGEIITQRLRTCNEGRDEADDEGHDKADDRGHDEADNGGDEGGRRWRDQLG